jgi:hypothetical protein
MGLLGTNRRNSMPPQELFLKCADGHFYMASLQTIRWRSVHFGTTQFRPCPVDRKWRKAVFVNPASLTPDELAQAQGYRV